MAEKNSLWKNIREKAEMLESEEDSDFDDEEDED